MQVRGEKVWAENLKQQHCSKLTVNPRKDEVKEEDYQPTI